MIAMLAVQIVVAVVVVDWIVLKEYIVRVGVEWE
jgi:hypothetical protein